MKMVTAAQMRELDRRAIEEFEIPGELLMERAGMGLADAVTLVARQANLASAAVHFFAGKGNNGGDAFAAARILHEMGVDPDVWLAAEESDVQGDAFLHLVRMKKEGVALHCLPGQEDWEGFEPDGPCDVVVDALLGTGMRGPARGPVALAIQAINRLAPGRSVVAADVPSGLHPDTGRPLGDAVEADLTVTFGFPKPAFALPDAAEWVGSVECVDIGLPRVLEEECSAGPELLLLEDVRGWFARRPAAAHKGMFGRVAVVGGSNGYTGAVPLACRAALRAGAGLVSAFVPRSLASIAASASLETMVLGVAETDAGQIDVGALDAWSRKPWEAGVVVLGPGLGVTESLRRLLDACLTRAAGTLVLDADALTLLGERLGDLRRAAGAVVLTPHPGELARLLGVSSEAVQADRPAAAQRAADRSGAVVALKGCRTVIAAPGRPHWVNANGNPGMAVGGMGDVLAGMVGSFLAQGLAPFEATCAAVFAHGRAGDLVAWRGSQAGTLPSDVVEELSFTMREIAPQ